MELPKIKSKKGILENLTGLAIGAASVLIIIVVAFLIMSTVNSQVGNVENIDVSNATECATSFACNATNTLRGALQDNVVGFIGLILLVAVASLLIFLVKRFR
jgi:hypothetical protein